MHLITFLQMAICLNLNIAPQQLPSSSMMIVQPETIEIGVFYSGATIKVTTQTADDFSLCVKIEGAESSLHLKKIGRKAGIFWMKTGELDLPALPSVYILKTQESLTSIASEEDKIKFGLGYDALRFKYAQTLPKDERDYFDEVIKLKEKLQLYSEETIVRTTTKAMQSYKTTFRMPISAKVPPGTYSVQLFGSKNNKCDELAIGHFKVVYSPVLIQISNLARNHGLLYGILAVFFAIIAGLLTGYIFKSKGSAH